MIKEDDLNKRFNSGSWVTNEKGEVIERNGVKVRTKEEKADDMSSLYIAKVLYLLTKYALVPFSLLLCVSFAATLIKDIFK